MVIKALKSSSEKQARSRPLPTPGLNGERRRKFIADRIEAAGLNLFNKHSFDEVTVAEIASKAGISKRTFFRYFPTKEDIILRRARQECEAICELILKRPSNEPPAYAGMQALIQNHRHSLENEQVLMDWRRLIAANASLRHLIAGFSLEVMVGALSRAFAERDGTKLTNADPRLSVIAAALLAPAHYTFFHQWQNATVGGELNALIAKTFDDLAASFSEALAFGDDSLTDQSRKSK